jgi:hypothetical protein
VRGGGGGIPETTGALIEKQQNLPASCRSVRFAETGMRLYAGGARRPPVANPLASVRPMTTGVRKLLLAGLLAMSGGSAFADPLTDLLDKGNGGACYDRVYDAAHLARNPKQATRSIRVSLRDYQKVGAANIRIEITSDKETSYIVGECNWEASANLGSVSV